MAGYGSLARIYDGEYRRFHEDVDLYLRCLSEQRLSGPILELGCGTGRVAIPLALAGYRVTGVDVSQEMLARARRRRRALDPEAAMRLRFSRQDMTSFEFPRRFSACVIAFSTFALVTDRGSRAQCLERIRHHLEPGGLLLIDLPQSDRAATDAVRRFESRFLLPPWGHVVDKVVEERQLTESASSAINYEITVTRYTDGEVVDRLSVSFGLARLARADVERMLYDAGFDVEQVFGDYLGRPCRASSPRLVFQARRL